MKRLAALMLLLASVAGAQELAWQQLTNYPSACSASQFVTAVGDTLTCQAVSSGAVAHEILDATYHSDSVADTVSKGSLIVGSSTPKWDELVAGSDGTHLVADSSQTLGVKWEKVSDTIGAFAVLSWANTTDPGGAIGGITSATWLNIPALGYWYQGSHAQYDAGLSHRFCAEVWVTAGGCTGNTFTIRLRNKTAGSDLTSFNLTVTASGTTSCNTFTWSAPATDAKIWVQAQCTIAGTATLNGTLATWVFK